MVWSKVQRKREIWYSVHNSVGKGYKLLFWGHKHPAWLVPLIKFTIIKALWPKAHFSHQLKYSSLLYFYIDIYIDIDIASWAGQWPYTVASSYNFKTRKIGATETQTDFNTLQYISKYSSLKSITSFPSVLGHQSTHHIYFDYLKFKQNALPRQLSLQQERKWKCITLHKRNNWNWHVQKRKILYCMYVTMSGVLIILIL